MSFERLKLKNQLCFPVYALSRLITREYQPYLNRLGITYPQYLVLMILWEENSLTVNEISEKLILNTNTVTPLLKRMEKMGLIKRNRSQKDERKVEITVTKMGEELKIKASIIPEKLIQKLTNSNIKLNDLIDLKKRVEILIDYLNKK
ncbi:MarR family transcriptional regulator [bacterium]|nr:MarR family transcriptional regulator [bacterium]